MSDGVRVAIAHDYLTQRGGAERVVLSMAKAFPDAPIYTTLYDPDLTFPEFADHDVRATPLNRWRWARRHHRALLPVFPLVASSVNIDADVVLSSSSGWSHGFRTTGTKVVYCYSPARWLYQSDTYLKGHRSSCTNLALQMLRPTLRQWDRRAAHSADRYLAISSVVQGRILDTYGVDSEVVPAPRTLATHVAHPASARTSDLDPGYFLCVARLLPYKNVDSIVAAFQGRPERLVVVGRGPELSRLRAMSGGNVTFLSDLSDADMIEVYRRCAAVVSASFEDYGLGPLEAGAAGRPAIVLRWGGFLDTVAEGRSGVFFDTPDPDHIRRALDRFGATHWDRRFITEWSHQFSEDRFVGTLRSIVDALPEALAADEAEPEHRLAV